MTESEFLDLTDSVLDSLQSALDAVDLDLDYQLNNGVLELEFENGEKMVINRHMPNREIWVAAKSGGFHFALDEAQQWVSRRDGSELHQLVSQLIAGSAAADFSWSH